MLMTKVERKVIDMGKKTVSKVKKPAKQASLGLVGLFVHFYKEGKIQYQGQIIGKEDDKVLVQMFEWLLGEPTDVQAFDKAKVYSADCKLYRDIETWKEIGDAQFKFIRVNDDN